MSFQKKAWKKYILFAAAACFLLSGGIWYVKEYTTVGNSVNGHEMPVCSVETDEKQAALTFETAWGDKKTGEILDILKEEKIRATFFVTAGWMREHPDLVGRMKTEGHDIGTMGVSHENLSVQTSAEIRAELQEAEHTAKEEGISMELFRPPYGRYSDTLIRTAAEEGFFTICWSIDSRDWKNYGKRSLIKEVVESEELRNGAIIRLNSEAKFTKDALKELIENIEEKSYEIVPVSEMILRDNYHMDVKGRQIPRMT